MYNLNLNRYGSNVMGVYILDTCLDISKIWRKQSIFENAIKILNEYP